MDELFRNKEDSDKIKKINLEELYDKKKTYDLSKLSIFNKILNRIHEKIKITSRQKVDTQFCWFVIPEIMLGVASYDRASCISYILEELTSNGFVVRYTHPNLIFISWMHYIPSYVRNEFKKKTGIVIDEHGNRLEEYDEYGNTVPPSTPKNNPLGSNSLDPFNMGLTRKIGSKNNADNTANKKEFKPINDYKPTGNLIYGRDLFKKIEDKFS
jgi:Family of unknown function (DUF5759)